ncbi:hypothetical protein [Paenibacillus xerothermodurans]|uniref:hypothetical protein n=1 Tax=Paenibacillus xerothermodurans TaxID=1977292 RepID=UPI0014040856|nr:hypothetical protein [Paenibacillus xerothermodurans]
MDKRKVIAAYRRGIISIHECAQILGIDSLKVMGLVNEDEQVDISHTAKKHSITS